MVDFSRAEGSKTHKNTFDKTAKTIMLYIETLQNSYMKTWELVERYRKERAAIIENIIQLLKSLKIKTSKPLGRSTNDEINQELNQIIPDLDFQTREKLQCDLVKINNRYLEINKLSVQLEDLMHELTSIRFPEKDNDMEVTIGLSADDTEQDQIKMISKASPTLIENVQTLLKQKLEAMPFESKEKSYDDYTVQNGQTFMELTREIYQNASLWINLYNFGDNKDVLDKRAELLNMDIQTLINTPHCLDDVTIKVPHELVTFVEVPLEQKKVA